MLIFQCVMYFYPCLQHVIKNLVKGVNHKDNVTHVILVVSSGRGRGRRSNDLVVLFEIFC